MLKAKNEIKESKKNCDSCNVELTESYRKCECRLCEDWGGCKEMNGYYSNRWLTCILVDPFKNKGLTREDIRLAMEAENIETRPLWKPMHQQPIFADCKSYLNGVSDKLFEDGLCLPSGSNLTDEEFDRIFESLDHIFAKYQKS